MNIHPDKLIHIGLKLRPAFALIDAYNKNLVADIKEYGQLLPIQIFKHEGKYYYIDGTRRVTACRELGIDVDCRFMDIGRQRKISLINSFSE